MKRILMSCLLCIGLALPGMVMSEEHENKVSVSLYGRLWPKVTYTNPSDGDPSTDIKDALSRIGVSADYKLSETLTAVLQAEMRVNLGADGSQDFLTEHLGYVGLQGSDFGLLAIGTQWNPYYNIVAEVTDTCTTTVPVPLGTTTMVRSVKNKSSGTPAVLAASNWTWGFR